MVLNFVRGWDNIPKNVKVLTEQEALAHQRKFVDKWEKPSEVFFLKYGSIISGFVTFTSSLPIIHHFRKEFKLNRFGLFATYMPGSALPALLSVFGYSKFVTSEILLMKVQCPICMELKYAAYHLCNSLVYSTLISIVTCSSVAVSRKTRYVPNPQNEGREYLKFIWKMTKAGSMRYHAMIAYQLAVVLLLPYLQVREFNNIWESAVQKERIMYDPEDSVSSETLLV